MQRHKRRLHRPPRAASTINIERSYYATIRAMLREARALVDRLVIPALPGIVAEAGLSPDRLDTWPETVDAIFDGMRVSYFQTVTDGSIRRAAQDAASATSTHGRKQLAKQIKAVIGVDPFLTEPWLNDMAAAFVKDNVGLITSIPERYFDEIEQSVNRGVRAGRRHEPMAREIKERYHVSEARAKLIARDQVSKFNGDLARVRQVGLGVDEYIWRTSGDERVRDSHAELDGQVFSWGKPPDVGHPGEDYQCLIGSANIEPTSGTVVLYRRWYDGELTELVTDSGKSLSATPNHPILTPRGWVPADGLNVGDYVFKVPDKCIDGAEKDVSDTQVCIQEMFDAVADVCLPVRRTGARAQFHGDGSDHEVDVIEIHGLLPDMGSVPFGQELGEFFLACADKAMPDALPGLGQILSVCRRLWSAPESILRGASKALFLIGGHACETENVRLAAITGRDPALGESSDHAASGDPIFAREGEDALSADVVSRKAALIYIFTIMRHLSSLYCNAPGAEDLAEAVRAAPQRGGDVHQGHAAFGVEPDRIVDKRVSVYSGHVYNLQTLSGHYTANNLIVKNCRCTAEPKLEKLLEGYDV